MAKHKTRVVTAWVGTTLLTLALASITLRITTWANAHHPALTGFSVACGVGAAIAALTWLLTEDDIEMAPQPPPNTPEMKMKAERDIVRSPQIGTVHGDVYMGDLTHVNPAPLPESISEVKIPRLLIRSPKRDYLASESQWFSRSGRGMPGMTVVVENPEATVGHQGIEATGVRAKIKFLRHDGELLGTSEYAHWLDILENRTNISVGESRVLVVGLYSNPKVWQYFSNKIDAPMQRARTFTQVQNLSARLNRPLEPQYILFNPTIEVRITLLSKYSGFTLAQKSFLLSTFSTMDGGRDFDFEELS